MMQQPRTARLLAVLIAVVAVAALVLNSHLGLLRNPSRGWIGEAWRSGRYFTTLTTLMVALAFAKVALTGRLSQGWAGGLAVWSAIVGIVYHAILARDLAGLRLWIDHAMHTAVPIAVMGWWLAFAPKAGLRKRHAVLWLGWPGLYMAYALIRGEIDGRHPYFFLDPPLIGWAKVIAWVPALGLVFLLAGLGLVALAQRLSRDHPRPADAVPGDPRPR